MLFTKILLSNSKILQKTLINVPELNVYLFFGCSGGSSTILGNFGTLILIRKWQDFAYSSARCVQNLPLYTSY